MKRKLICISWVSLPVVLFLLFPTHSVASEKVEGKTDVSFMAGFREDNLDWNIRAYTGPNVLSELTWRDMQIFQLRGDIININSKGYYFRGSAAFGWVQDGENQDSDYAGDNRTLEFSRSINGVDGSKTRDFQGGLGAVFPFGVKSQHHFSPLIGFAYHSQDFRMRDGRQVVSNLANAQILDPSITSLPPLGPFPGLNSSYETTWKGFWVGIDTEFDLEDKGIVFVQLENHWPKYSATANWNLRSDFAHPVSFRHDANGQGVVLELGWKNVPSYKNWQWGVNMSWKKWKTQSGVDRTYFYDNTYYDAVLNEVNWSSSQINITANKEIDF